MSKELRKAAKNTKGAGGGSTITGAGTPSHRDILGIDEGTNLDPLDIKGKVGGKVGGVVKPLAQTASAVDKQGAKVISGGKGGTVARIIFAFGMGLVALEVASYLSGRYFTYSLKAGSQKLQTASQHIGFYPGQTAKLQAMKEQTPQSSALRDVSAALPSYASKLTMPASRKL